MTAAEQLITANLDIWSSAIKAKSAAGRGKSNKLELYGIKKLRELILELAVRGLLVPQDPNDEPANELLKKIATEKAQLIKEGKVKRARDSSKEDVAPLFDIPASWGWARLSDIGSIFNGNSVNARTKAEKYTGIDGLPYIATKDVGYGFELLDYTNGISIPFDEPKFKVAQQGAVLICSEGGSAGKKCGITDQNICFGNKLYANQVFGGIEPKYVLSLYLTPSFFDRFTESMTGIIGGISTAKFMQLPAPIPPLAEQARIVAKVDELMALCDQLEQQQETSITAHQALVQTLLDALTNASERDGFTAAWVRIANHFDTLFTTEWSIDQLKQTILQLTVMGKLVPQDPSDEPAIELLKKIAAEKAKLVKDGKIKNQKALPPIEDDEKLFQLPVGWEWVRLQDITNLITDGKHGDCNDHPNSGYYFLSAKDIQNGQLVYDHARQIVKCEFEEVHQRTNLEPLDICMVNTGATVGKIAVAGEGDVTRKTTFQKSVAVIKATRPYVDTGFLRHYLVCEAPNLLKKSGGSAINNLLLGDLKKKVLMLPPFAEQLRIVAKVGELMALCDMLKGRINNAQTTQLQMADAIAEQAVS